MDSGMISIKIKMPTKSFDVEVEDNCMVVDLRKVVAQNVQKDPNQLVLIFGGKILKDEESIETHSIKNNHSVHLVIKNQRQESKQEPSAPYTEIPNAAQNSPATPDSTTPSPGNGNPFAGLGGTAANVGGLLRGNNLPGFNEQMQNMMNHPELMNQFMESPVMQNMMQSILDNPPLLQEMIRSNPQMNQVIEQNPDLAHIFNNPALIRQAMEMQRNPSMMQEMMRHQDRAMSNIENLPGGFQALERMYRDIQEPMMNAAARPNQYQSSNNENNSSTSNQAGRQNTEALPNPWGGNTTNRQQNTTRSANDSTEADDKSSTGGTGINLNQNMMQQAMNMMQSNPELMRTMMNSMNPQLASNPMMQRFLQTPEITNPNVIQALRQITESYDTIRREAPQLWESFGFDTNMQQMMQQMGSTGLSSTTAPAPDAATRFASQIEQLEMMGFTDRAANIEELTRTGGNVEAAVDRLLNRPR